MPYDLIQGCPLYLVLARQVSVQHCCIGSQRSPGLWSSILGVFTKLRQAPIHFVMSVRLSAYNKLAPTERICVNTGIENVCENMSRESKFSQHSTNKMHNILTEIHML